MADDLSSGAAPEKQAHGTTGSLPKDPLEIARVRAVYVFLVLIAALTAASLVPQLQLHLDLGVFGTLVGALLALLGLGAVIRLVVGK